MVSHQAKSVNLAIRWQLLAFFVGGLDDGAQDFHEFHAVDFVVEDVHAVDAAQHHVVNACGAVLSRCACHNCRVLSLFGHECVGVLFG